MTKTKKQMLQMGEVLNMLGVSKLTLRRMMRQGEIDYFRVGKQYRFSMIDIENYLIKNKNKPVTR
jgi:excisionase family DNA binding protein